MDPAVAEAVHRALVRDWGNPNSAHAAGRAGTGAKRGDAGQRAVTVSWKAERRSSQQATQVRRPTSTCHRLPTCVR